MTLSTLLLAPVAALAPSDGTTWTITDVVLEGDAVPAVGNVTLVSRSEVSDTGHWLVEVDTDGPDTNTDGALLRDGLLYLIEGQPLALPTGALLDSFDSFMLNDAGSVSFNFFLDGTTGTGDDSGIYVDVGSGPVLLYQESQTLGVPGPANGAPWLGFFETWHNDLNQVLTLGSLDVAGVGTSVDRILLRTTVDGTGAIVNEEVVVLEGDILPGQTEIVDDIKTGSHQTDLNDSGLVAFIADLAGDTTVDHAIYFAGSLIAQEGSPSPIPGRNWSSLSSAELDISNSGNIVYSGTLDGDTATGDLIVLNGAKFRQEGDPVPVTSLAAFSLTSFGTGPIFVDDSGGVLWYGDWNDPDLDVDTGLFYNDELIIQEGVTVVAGLVVDTIRGISEGFMMSNGGGFATVRLSLVGGIECVVLLTRDAVIAHEFGCVPNPNDLLASGDASLGGSLQLDSDYNAGSGMDSGIGLLYVAPGPAPGGGPCGVDLGFGEVLIDFTASPKFLGSGLSASSTPWTKNFPIPLDESFLGADLWFQTAFVDVLDPVFTPITLTNAVHVCIGSQP